VTDSWVVYSNLEVSVICTLDAGSGTTYDVSLRFSAHNVSFHDAVLIYAHRRQSVEHPLVARINAIHHEAEDNLLPRRPAFVPKGGPTGTDYVAEVLHDTVVGSGK